MTVIATEVLPSPTKQCADPDDMVGVIFEAALRQRALDGNGHDRDWLTIAEVAEGTGVTAHTLRYYERIGLVDVPRDAAGRRRYGRYQVSRVVVITRLRLSAMPISGVQEYFGLVDAGPGTEPERLALLERHRAQVIAQIADLHSALAVIDFKIGLYGGPTT